MKIKKAFTLSTDQQLMNCIHSKVYVEVWVGGTFDCLSRVTDYNDVVLTLEDGKYIRSNCVLKTRENYFSAL